MKSGNDHVFYAYNTGQSGAGGKLDHGPDDGLDHGPDDGLDHGPEGGGPPPGDLGAGRGLVVVRPGQTGGLAPGYQVQGDYLV